MKNIDIIDMNCLICKVNMKNTDILKKSALICKVNVKNTDILKKSALICKVNVKNTDIIYDRILALSKFKAFVDNKLDVVQNIKFVIHRVQSVVVTVEETCLFAF